MRTLRISHLRFPAAAALPLAAGWSVMMFPARNKCRHVRNTLATGSHERLQNDLIRTPSLTNAEAC
jgi:hypothetical protein